MRSTLSKSRLRAMFGAAMLLLLCNTACYHLTYTTGRPRSGVTHTGTTHFFLWGLAGHPDVNLAEKCPQGVSKVRAWQTFGDSALRVITLGIYTPRSYEVWCASDAQPAAAPAVDPAPNAPANDLGDE